MKKTGVIVIVILTITIPIMIIVPAYMCTYIIRVYIYALLLYTDPLQITETMAHGFNSIEATSFNS